MKPAVKTVQEWLKTCPMVAEQLGNNVAFHIDYLPEDTTQFSIEDSPGDPVLQEFFSGRRKAKNYVLASRMGSRAEALPAAEAARRGWRSAPVFARAQVPQRKSAKRKRRRVLARTTSMHPVANRHFQATGVLNG